MKRKRKPFIRSGKFYVYILRCSDSTFYTGYTPDLKNRFKLHSSGKGAKYTRTRLPVELIWWKEYKYFKKAFLEEIRIKRLRKKQKEKLINEFKKRKVGSRKRHNRLSRIGGRNREAMVRIII